MQQAYPGFDAAVVLYMGAPLAFNTGITIADVRALRLHHASAEKSLTAYEIELKVRYMLHAALWGHPFKRGVKLSHGNAPSTDIEVGSSGMSNSNDRYDINAEGLDASRRKFSPSNIADADAVFSLGCAKFKNSDILHIFFARFHMIYSNNKHLQMR